MRIYGLYALLALAAAGYTGYWFVLADRADVLVEAQIETWRDHGVAVSHGGRRVFGYPYRLSSEFSDFAVDVPLETAVLRWQGERLTIHAQPWNLRHYVSVLEGRSRYEVAKPGGTIRIDAEAEAARASLVLDDSYRPTRGSAEVKSAILRTPGRAEPVLLQRAQVHARRPESSPQAVEAAIIVDGMVMLGRIDGMLGAEVRHLALRGTVTGPVPERLDQASLALWRDGGGSIEAFRLAIGWGPLDITAEGMLTLDHAMRPRGALTARIVGHDRLIDTLETTGVINDDLAAAMRLTFGLLAEPASEGGSPLLVIPIVIRDGWLAAGPLPIIEVPPIFPSG